MDLEFSIDGDGFLYFSDFIIMLLIFLVGSIDNVCFELLLSVEVVVGIYIFQFKDGNGEEVVSFEVVVELLCISVVGLDYIICVGEIV